MSQIILYLPLSTTDQLYFKIQQVFVGWKVEQKSDIYITATSGGLLRRKTIMFEVLDRSDEVTLLDYIYDAKRFYQNIKTPYKYVRSQIAMQLSITNQIVTVTSNYNTDDETIFLYTALTESCSGLLLDEQNDLYSGTGALIMGIDGESNILPKQRIPSVHFSDVFDEESLL